MIFRKFISVILCLVVFSGCGQNLESNSEASISKLILNGEKKYNPQKLFKSDTDYFLGLRALKEGKISQAERLFRRCAKNGSSYCAKKSYEQLAKLGNVQERQKTCEAIVKKYNDDDSKLLAAKEYEASDEYAKIINLTSKIDVDSANNSLIFLRLKSLIKKNVSFIDEMYQWFLNRTISAEHYKFYTNYIKNTEFVSQQLSEEKLKLIEFRIEVYRKNYKVAYEKMFELDNSYFKNRFVVSDAGKSCLYGNSDYIKNAQFFDKISNGTSDNAVLFYSNFYAGRMYDKAVDYYSLSTLRFKSAMNHAVTDENYDNALWYLLNAGLKKSSDTAIDMIKKYCPSWHNPEYFDDFFEILSPILISERKWNEFYDIYKSIDGYASDAITAKYAYIYGRLLEEKFATPVIGDTHQSECTAAFTRALSSGSDVYYRVMALNKLGYGGETEEEVLCQSEMYSEFEVSEDAEKLLLGYAVFGFPEMIFSEWNNIVSSGVKISFDTAIKLATFLNVCGKDKNEYYPQSLRIAAKAFSKTDVPVTKESLKLLYPRNYSSFVKKYCEEYEISEEIMYALIRTESFFDADIKSSAGAIGLTQLMIPTASDIARKLRVKEYSLENPEQNIQFGTYYISELIHRLDGNVLAAFFSYNAGITRVRRWLKTSKIEFNNTQSLPIDLFLETVPYEETRGYGRKLIGAASLYGWLYYDKPIYEVVSSIVE